MQLVDGISAEEYQTLRAAVGWKPLTTAELSRGLEHSVCVRKAVENGAVVGAGRLVTDGGAVFMLFDLIVRPEWQRKGIGRALVDSLATWVRAQRAEGGAVILCLIAQDGAAAFYERLGFRADAELIYGVRMSMRL